MNEKIKGSRTPLCIGRVHDGLAHGPGNLTGVLLGDLVARGTACPPSTLPYP